LLRRVEPECGPSTASEIWEALVHPGQRLRAGSRLKFGLAPDRIDAEILDRRFHGRRLIRLWTASGDLQKMVDALGHVPLPPYIKRSDTESDRDGYQTVYARARGSIAAPTAGLHFTNAILDELAASGIERTAITLHVGYGTFQPIRAESIADHRMESECFEVPPVAAEALNRATRDGRRIIAVGTTTTRALESLTVGDDGRVREATGSTELFIRPGHRFRLVTGLITNFHLPRSSLLLLVSAFAGRDRVLAAYRHAIRERYRFYSYGDAMLIV
jgi:S-adenosylmethionine:tRNA ribosyltransferase-isomerase